MPFYFFDIIDNGQLNRDEFGLDLVDFAEAREQAIVLLPDIARDEFPDGDLHVYVCEVRDAQGRIVYRANLTYTGERLIPEP